MQGAYASYTGAGKRRRWHLGCVTHATVATYPGTAGQANCGAAWHCMQCQARCRSQLLCEALARVTKCHCQHKCLCEHKKLIVNTRVMWHQCSSIPHTLRSTASHTTCKAVPDGDCNTLKTHSRVWLSPAATIVAKQSSTAAGTAHSQYQTRSLPTPKISLNQQQRWPGCR